MRHVNVFLLSRGQAFNSNVEWNILNVNWFGIQRSYWRESVHAASFPIKLWKGAGCKESRHGPFLRAGATVFVGVGVHPWTWPRERRVTRHLDQQFIRNLKPPHTATYFHPQITDMNYKQIEKKMDAEIFIGKHLP